MSPPLRQRARAERNVLRVRADDHGERVSDQVAVEEPLEIRVDGETLAVTMRTPGQDRELALGWLFSEGIARALDEVGSVAHCGRPGSEQYGNTIDVRSAPGVVLGGTRDAPQRRGTLTTSACGVCGRSSVEDLLSRCGHLPPGAAPPLSLLRASVAKLQAHQPHFDRTGGLHCAAALDASENVLAAAEDVGRHNAVDKVVGALLLAGMLREGGPVRVLAVSGRLSFELVHKACVARIPALCGVSAPSSLAIDLADRCGMTLAGFVRDGALNLYAGSAGTPPG